MRAVDVAFQRWITCRVPGDEDSVVFDVEVSDFVQNFHSGAFPGRQVSAPIFSLPNWKTINNSLSQFFLTVNFVSR